MNKSRAERVKEFTEQSMGIELPTFPRVMTRQEVEFIVRMNLEELQELLQTVVIKDEETPLLLLIEIAKKTNPPTHKTFNSDTDLIAHQVDAFADIDYYNNNAACKAGMNVDDIFDVVHQANMNKKFPDNTFHRNEIGKVIKPPNWQEPDVIEKIKEWQIDGSW